MDSVRGRTAFITGGAGGIGLAIGEVLLGAGAKVILADIDAAQLAAAASFLEGEVLTLTLDVTDRDAWRDARRKAEARFGQVDILCNNAGIGGDGRPLATMAPESFDRIIRINLTGAYNGVAAFLPPMVEREVGHVVNVASMSGLLARPTLAAYGASKFGLVGLGECLREEVDGRGIGVTTICPGRVATRISETTRAAGSERPTEQSLSVYRSISADEVGLMALDAILTNDPLVITHPEYRPQIEARSAAIALALDRADLRKRRTDETQAPCHPVG